jgi:hypothetical protein
MNFRFVMPMSHNILLCFLKKSVFVLVHTLGAIAQQKINIRSIIASKKPHYMHRLKVAQ